MKYIFKYILVCTIVFSNVSCNKEYLDPNSILEPAVVDSSDNLVKLLNGIQNRYSTERNGIIYTSVHLTGLNTGELRLLNPGNLGENEILTGGNIVGGNNEIINNIWTTAMLCRKEATTVYEAADSNGLKAYALFYRALSNGTLIEFFESIPLEIIENAPFKSRSEVLQSVIADLTEAKSYASSASVAGIIPSVNIKNSIDALLARYNLMAGNYSEAIAAASSVDLSAKSTWKFDSAIPNILAFWFSSQNVTQAKNMNFALPESLAPESGDKRVSFYVSVDDPNAASPNYQIEGFYKTNLDEIPVYLPGEMLLIKAEAYARSNDMTNAIAELNKVRTKTAASDAFGVGAELSAYAGATTQAAVLDEIYRNRRIELYLTGLGLEDSRRFNRPSSERNRNYYPYPNAERDNNTSTPANPSN
jgi:hypothetical protein